MGRENRKGREEWNKRNKRDPRDPRDCAVKTGEVIGESEAGEGEWKPSLWEGLG